ncbi:VWA domain-containing protein [Salegentibacter mishustinae]|uniref:BatB protein n=1 Tax=Salegentibacter mishustinae TaxID=270918 RepID=A0A0Q9ZAE8_9FLAO|nr:VWA domain-containing protein [Salegentibacter mishustinae]KRG29980.1 BatB protein [Salegentibacter mishustinae]PNW20613.1 BatB protein [Salegentibacter mishustinae]PZX61623.1 Ca-activated chloride channel family protein [Salegentibacter mishustinae]GGW98735.1 BatB protein [Salegentibacter mishustinae]
MILEEKIYLWLLLLIPVVLLVYLIFRIWQKRARSKFAKPELLGYLSPNRSSFKPLLKVLLIVFALAALVVGLVNPKIGSQLETVKREGVDIVFAVDVSKSMEAEDIAPSRLEKSKQLVRQIIGNLGSDRVGIIAYAGSAFPQLPITTDYGSAEMFLESLNTDVISSQGTAIGDAIDLATGFFDDNQQTNRVMFIISDGEDHGGNIEDMARQAAEAGIRIYTIGVGTTKGGPIPIKRNGVIQNYKKDNQGETVITKLDPSTLQEIAEEANGEYIDGNVTAEVTEKVQEELLTIEKTEFEAKQFADYKSQFQWFVGLAILLLLLDVFMLERKTGWIRRLNLFNEKRKTEE